jgi:hypothetical protein
MNAGTGLADLLKDEILPKPMPMNVSTQAMLCQLSTKNIFFAAGG